MPMQRLENVEDRQAMLEESLRNIQAEFLLMQQAAMKVDVQREIMEETQKRHGDEIRELKVMAAEMREGNTRLAAQYDSIKTEITKVLLQTQETNRHAQQLNSKERLSTQRVMIEFLKWTIGAIIAAYAVTNIIQ